MSNLIIPVATIEKLTPHTNADSLELAQILGWQMVVRKGEYKINDKVTYFPIDTVLPQDLSDTYGVTKYLSKGRIRCAKLRGEPSFGLAVKPFNPAWEVGQDVAEHYISLGVKKYEPPVRASAGDARPEHPLFQRYTDIENMRNFPHVFQEGEIVALTEKIHGTNSRVGIIEGEFMAGSHKLCRKRPADDNFAANLYWYPLSLPPVRTMLEGLGAHYRQVILFGEIYGSKVQSLDYGHKGTLGYRVFDVFTDGKYRSWQEVASICDTYSVETVPVVAKVLFNIDKVKNYSEGNTLLMEDNAHIREGLVVRPFYEERQDPKIGRCILKYVSDQYLFGKQTDYTDQ
jgi:RNA ligase (TIGR02306 family)